MVTLALIAATLPRPALGQARVDFAGPLGSSTPFLTATPSSRLLLTWFERGAAGRYTLRLAARDGGRWSAPRTVASGDRFFVNWADFPSVVETTTGVWVVHWLEKTEAKPYAYHVRFSRSLDQGLTWSTPETVHSDRSPTEHGFVAMVPDSSGGVGIAWLDGRETANGGGSMSLRAATIQPDGRVAGERLVDPRTCDCCQVAMARTDAGLVAVYRDRSDQEVRDIAVVRELGGRWSAPALVSHDGWEIRACPVNGPSIDASGQTVAVAWFTLAQGRARVSAALSHDGGGRFGGPIPIDDGNPVGRVQIRLDRSGRAVVVWLEATRRGAEWRMRTLDASGRPGPARVLGTTERGRGAGFARTAMLGDDLFVTWAEPERPGRVMVYRVERR